MRHALLIAEWLEHSIVWKRIADDIEIKDVNGDMAKKDRCLARAWMLQWCAVELLNDEIVKEAKEQREALKEAASE